MPTGRQKLAGARRGFRRAPLVTRQPAYKPGSGWHAGVPAYVTAIPLGRRLPGASSNLPERPDLDTGPGHHCLRADARAVPMRSCSRWGLPCRRRYRRRGALLPHRFTLAGPSRCRAEQAVCSLWHFPWARTRRTLSGTVCPWSPDFPPRQPFGFAGAAVRPTDGERDGVVGRRGQEANL